MNPSILIPYKENNSEELDFALIGLKNLPHSDIHVVTHSYSTSNPYLDVEMKVRSRLTELAPRFYLMADDIFIVEEIEDMPRLHRGTLEEHIAERNVNDLHTRALKTTRDFLINHGIEEPLSYELHMPFAFNKARYKKYSDLILPYLKQNRNLLIRSIYGNMEKLKSEKAFDCKNPENFEGRFILSTSEKSFRDEPIGEYIRSKLGGIK